MDWRLRPSVQGLFLSETPKAKLREVTSTLSPYPPKADSRGLRSPSILEEASPQSLLGILSRFLAGSRTPPPAQLRQHSSGQASPPCKPNVEVRGQLSLTVILGAPTIGAGVGLLLIESPLFCGGSDLIPHSVSYLALPLGPRPSPPSDSPGPRQ